MSEKVLLQKILYGFETHNPDIIKDCFEKGLDPNSFLNDKPLIYELINMYLRGPLFSSCFQLFVDYGLVFEDKPLLTVLLNDGTNLDNYLSKDSTLIEKRYSLDCTFTPLYEVTLLHICAEYNLVEAAKILIKYGADVNAKAGLDSNGFGGQTPIFHTVNQHENRCIEMLHLLLYHHAELHHTVKGLIWGRGYPWETFIPAVNPISYAMMGLLRQFQRTEKDIYQVIRILMQREYEINYFPSNVPNLYLQS
jgi:hypothetical protein